MARSSVRRHYSRKHPSIIKDHKLATLDDLIADPDKRSDLTLNSNDDKKVDRIANK